jgi:hypothetical protein
MKDPSRPPLSEEDRYITLQNLVVSALGYDKPITDTSYLEYGDYDDYITESMYGRLLDEYLDYSIGEFFNLSSEEFMSLPADIMTIYIDRARKKKEKETAEIERAQQELETAQNQQDHEEHAAPALHPTQQMVLDAQKKNTKEGA